MNWIKKLFKVLQPEDTKSMEEVPGDQNHSTIRKQLRENGKDVQAKVVYQYPKGEFRFPLIPDNLSTFNDKKQSRSKQERSTSLKSSKQSVSKVQQKSQGIEPSFVKQRTKRNIEPSYIHQSLKEKKEPVHKKEQPKQRSGELPKQQVPEREVRLTRPFTPTMIPSPIYGFKDRPVSEKGTEETFEYELQSFEAPEQVEQETNQSSQRHSEIPINHSENVVNDTDGFIQPIIEEVEVEAEVEVDEVRAEVKSNHEASGLVLVEPEIEVEEVHQYQEELEVADEAEIETKFEVIQQTPEEIEIEIEIEELPENLEIAVSLEEEVLQQEDSDVNVIYSQHEEDESDIQSDLESEPVSEQRKERSSIPFNVIMLKQDKQKLMMKENSPLSGEETIIEKTQPLEQEVQQVLAFENREETQESKNEETLYEVNRDAIQKEQDKAKEYTFPSIDLLNPPLIVEGNDEWIDEQAELLDSTLKNFNVGAQVVKVTQGPAVTRFEVQPEPGVKVNKITNLSDDIKLSLAARDIRIEAPIPGKHTIGIEVPNRKSRAVNISEIINHPEFEQKESPLTAVLGLDISGKPVVTDLRKMPHGLIAGATGSGKSVCINTMLVSLLYKATPNELKLLLIDPKMVELAPYNHIPHLVSPVITDVKAATAALKWAVEEMERRYELFAHTGVRDIARFNELAKKHGQYADELPYIVIVIDELADLMMMSPADVEEAICRIAQKARACGIHLIIATQRPSVDVITGLIKANIPTRIAFSVSSQVDSRTIIDISGAEKLFR